MYKSIQIKAGKSPVTVVGVFEEKTLPDGVSSLEKSAEEKLSQALKTPGFKAEVGEVVPAPGKFALLGLGKRDECEPDTLRKAGAMLVKALCRMEAKAIKMHVGNERSEINDTKIEAAGRCLAEGICLGNWRVDFFDGVATKNDKARGTLAVTSQSKKFRKGLTRGLALAESTNYARKLGATPPNICNPTWLAAEARRAAKKTGLSCKVINYTQAKKLKMGGLINVGMASKDKPCLIILEHKPEKIAAKAKNKTLALVGKTITYDTGGYSIKGNNGMKGMKYDKNGGMAVFGAMHAIASLNLPVHVVGFLPTAENMVAGDAYRPDDIITMYNGTTVEVTNTDAEGRLVLADALAYACKHYKPTAIIDAATLTGGVVVALGSWAAGLFCNDNTLIARVQDAADISGERIWRLPLWEEHRDFMRAKHADIWNSAPKREGHAIQGAAFLSFFVENKIPWAHLDIAGTNSVDSDDDIYVTGPTGYGVRLLTDIAEGYTR